MTWYKTIKQAVPGLLWVVGITTVWRAASLSPNWSWFSNHFAGMIIGWITLVGVGVLIKKEGGYENTKIHQYLTYMAGALILFGFYAIYSNKEELGKPHFTTAHGRLGVGLVVLMIASALISIVALNPDNGFLKTNSLMRTAHKWSGKVLIFFSWCLCYNGLVKIGVPSTTLYLFMASLSFCGIFVLGK